MQDQGIHRVRAINLARNSENRMHDDTVARRFGFAGGLVPGVDVLAYMCHVPLQHFGRAFLQRGYIEGRFVKPVYDGEWVEASGQPDAERLRVTLRSRGETCATAVAGLHHAPLALDLADYVSVPPVAMRQPVDESTYARDSWLGIPPWRQDADAHRQYLADIGETDAVYLTEGLVHPGMLLRLFNWALMENGRLGPWIHVGSRLDFVAPAQVGEELTVRAKVVANEDRKGHHFVELDGVIVAEGRRAVARCHHVAIVRPRQTAAN